MEEKSFEGMVLKELPKHLFGRREIQVYYNSRKFDCRKRAESGGNSQKTPRGYCMVSRRSEKDLPIHLYAQNPNGGEFQDFN